MKTAEEWMKQLGGHDLTGEYPPIITVNRQIIREIQLDAYKAGMSEASRLVETILPESKEETIERIIAVRDRKTSL